MLPTTADALTVILLAIVPGFIANAIWARARTWKGRGSDLITILQSLAISALIQAIAAPLITIPLVLPFIHYPEQHAWRIFTWVAVVVFLLPVAGGSFAAWITDATDRPESVWSKIRGFPWLREQYRKIVHPVPAPTLWDAIFSESVPINAFIVVEFGDGKFIGGVFGEGSQAYTSPDPQGLFLSSQWTVTDNGDLIAALPGTLGVMITNTADVRSVRVLEGTP